VNLPACLIAGILRFMRLDSVHADMQSAKTIVVHTSPKGITGIIAALTAEQAATDITLIVVISILFELV
jgi:hypothetical protein